MPTHHVPVAHTRRDPYGYVKPTCRMGIWIKPAVVGVSGTTIVGLRLAPWLVNIAEPDFMFRARTVRPSAKAMPRAVSRFLCSS